MADKVLMLGNEAIARGAYEAGVKVSSAYPGTPSTEISEFLVQYKDDIYEEWAPNEKVAAEVAVGASIAGVRSMACMKHVGLNVAADPLYSVSYMGVNGGLVLDKKQRVAVVEGEEVHLTATEYKILELLMEHPGQVFPAEQIYERVWGGVADYTVENTVMVHIRHIREKIEIDTKKPRYVKVVWGIGYKMEKYV